MSLFTPLLLQTFTKPFGNYTRMDIWIWPLWTLFTGINFLHFLLHTISKRNFLGNAQYQGFYPESSQSVIKSTLDDKKEPTVRQWVHLALLTAFLTCGMGKQPLYEEKIQIARSSPGCSLLLLNLWDQLCFRERIPRAFPKSAFLFDNRGLDLRITSTGMNLVAVHECW